MLRLDGDGDLRYRVVSVRVRSGNILSSRIAFTTARVTVPSEVRFEPHPRAAGQQLDDERPAMIGVIAVAGSDRGRCNDVRLPMVFLLVQDWI